MTEPPVGVRVTERFRGELGDEDLTMYVTAELTLDEKVDAGPARVVGHVDHAPWGGRVLLAGGRLELTGPDLVYRARARVDGRWVEIEAARKLTDDDGLDAWADATTVAL